MPVFHFPSGGEQFPRAHAAHWLRRIGLHLDYLIGPADEHWHSVPEWLTDYFHLPEPPDKIARSDAPGHRRWLTQYLKTLEIPEPPPSGTLWQNITWLFDRLQLSDDERQLVTFVLCAFEHQPLGHVINGIETDGITDAYRKLACILDLPEIRVRQALGAQTKLSRLGFVSPRRHPTCLKELIELDESLTEALCMPHRNEDALIQQFARPESPSALSLADFSHIQLEVDLIVRTIQAAIANNAPGVNILLYGAPGSGKSELARVIAKTLGLTLYGAGCEHVDNGETATGNERLSSYHIAQHMIAPQGNALVLFDEAEDVFVPEFFLHSENSSINYSRAWMNRMLESNPVPAIWICNRVRQIAPAYRRRFDMVLRMHVLPMETRRKLITSKLHRHQLSASLQETLVSLPRLLPYHLDKLDKLLSRVQLSSDDNSLADHSGVSPATPDQIAGVWLRENAALFDANPKQFARYADASSKAADQFRLLFDWKHLGLQGKNKALLNNLLQCDALPECAMLISGLEDSGKSEIVQQLGFHFNMPVLSRSIADILHWQPGDMERRLLAAFREADETDALLVLEGIDTYDSVLRAIDVGDYPLAQSVTRTLAACLAQYGGMVIATAREPKKMDTEVMRRFGVQLALSPMDTKQSQSLFETLCGSDALKQYPLLKTSLEKLSLVPGDYAEALKQLRLYAMGLMQPVEPQEDTPTQQDHSASRIAPRQLLMQLKIISAARATA